MKGQIILVIILIMATALGVGLAVVQRSLSDISTSTKVEESSRAFSAAEAGIERALRTQSSGSLDLGLGQASVSVTSDLPEANRALEYPPQSKEEIAQVWLTPNYTNSNFDLYFGAAATADKPAVEVTVVTLSGGNYGFTKKFFDADSSRATTNGFTTADCLNPTVLTNANATPSTFYCKMNVSYSGTPILARVRILYSAVSQPIAVAPTAGSLPPQAKIFVSTGVAGTTQRRVQLFKLDKVVPFYFDYGLFSVGEIIK